MKVYQIIYVFLILISITIEIQIRTTFEKQNSTVNYEEDSLTDDLNNDIVPNPNYIEFIYNGITFTTYNGSDSTNKWIFSLILNFKINENIIEMPFEGELFYNSNLNLTDDISFLPLINSPIDSEGRFFYENLIEIKQDLDDYTITLITIYYKDKNGEVKYITGKLYTDKYNIELNKNENGAYDYKITYVGKKNNPTEYKNKINGVAFSGYGKGEIKISFSGELTINSNQNLLLSGFFTWDISKKLEDCIFVKLFTPFEKEKVIEYDKLVSIVNTNEKVIILNIEYLDGETTKTLQVVFYKNENNLNLIKDDRKYKFTIEDKNKNLISTQSASFNENCN